MKKLVMAGLVGMIMMAGSGVFGGITATSKVFKMKKQKTAPIITVTITKPAKMTFVSASWVGPNNLIKGKLILGTNTIKATKPSEVKNDYKFTVVWKWTKPFAGEKTPLPETASSTFYTHRLAFFHAEKKGDTWNTWVTGHASPINATINGSITFGTKQHKKNMVLVKKDYTLPIKNLVVPGGIINFDISASSDIDGILSRSVNTTVDKKKFIAWMK